MVVPPQTFTGSIGVTGLAGPQGITGLWGVTGFSGATGIQGVTGIQGMGSTGLQGVTGLPGLSTQGLTGVQGSTGLSGGSGAQGATGIKAAILFLKGQHRALSCVESPDTRFEDLIETELVRSNQRIAIDPLFIEACEPDSIRVRSVHSETMGLGYSRLSVDTKDGVPEIMFAADDHVANVLCNKSLPIYITLTGLRRGYKMRFPVMTQEQADNNMKFWDAALKH